jgi:hypothetical protein
MSHDRADFQETVASQLRGGGQPQFNPIVINPAVGGPGGTPMQIGVSYAISIQACDHIWLPTFFDPSIALNPAQGDGSTSNEIAYQGPNFGGWGTNAYPPIGMNVFDLFDASDAPTPIQSAAIFSLQFNSNSAPWLLWSLSDLLCQDTAPSQSPGGCGCLVGSGDAMRSISGPISSMNFKLLFPALIQGSASLAASQIVLMSSTGYRQETRGARQSQMASTALTTGGYPQANSGPVSTAVTGGGYVQTNINTLERETLRTGGLGTSRRVGNG